MVKNYIESICNFLLVFVLLPRSHSFMLLCEVNSWAFLAHPRWRLIIFVASGHVSANLVQRRFYHSIAVAKFHMHIYKNCSGVSIVPVSDFAKTHKKWNLFSEIDTLGTYDFFTSLVELSSLVKADFDAVEKVRGEIGCVKSRGSEKIINHLQYSALSKVLPLAAHEYTHFIDSTSTLWGLRHLKLLSDAYLADNVRGGKEEDFYLARRFYDHARSIHLPKYYTTIEDDVLETRPWKPVITIGKVFASDGRSSSRPVLFSRFFNAADQSITRSPISTISILEASAMAQELIMQGRLLDSAEEDFRTVENSLCGQKVMTDLYNKKLTEYSVCLHVLSHYLGFEDAMTGFGICGVLTRIVLNMPKSCLEAIISKCNISALLRIPPHHEFELRLIEGVRCGDLGVLFYLLCRALPRMRYASHSDTMEGVLVALEKLGIPLELVISEGATEAATLADSLSLSGIESVRTIAHATYENFRKIDYARVDLDFDNLNLPPVLLKDNTVTTIFSSATNSLAALDLDKSYDELVRGQEWVDRFSEACL